MADKQRKFELLTDNDKILVLRWQREAIHSGLKKMVEAYTHRQFAASLHGGAPFQPERVWSLLPLSSQHHFEHAKKVIVEMDEKINSLERSRFLGVDFAESNAADFDPTEIDPMGDQ